MTERIDFVLLGMTSPFESRRLLTMAVFEYIHRSFDRDDDTPLGAASNRYSADELFAGHSDRLMEIFTESGRTSIMVPCMVRYSTSEDEPYPHVLEIKPISDQTLEQIKQFAWAKEGM
jgi:hypothetical protein